MAAAGHWDWIVIGSGFGGSVCALRLAEKGYRVLVLEQGRRLRAGDFPRSNWNLKRWLWAPRLGFRGPFRISFMRHLTAFYGVGVGGGSLIYANTLPQPAPGFFRAPGWSGLADWKRELEPHYATALRMRLLEELDRDECAAALDVTVGNFDVIFHRACKAFRKVYVT